MFGPSFDSSGKLVEREVPIADVNAYKKAGYELGHLPEVADDAIESADEELAEVETVKVTRGRPRGRR